VSRWFRMYDELLDDPKVQRLNPADFKGWVNLLCLASRNGGKLPSIPDIAFALRETENSVSTLVERLRSGGLIERRCGGADGAFDAPYRWSERQYKSDTSTDRVKRFRQRSRNAGETPPETDTEAEKKTEAKASSKSLAEKREAVGSCLRRAFPPPLGVSEEQWDAFRKQRKKQLNDRSYALLSQKLLSLADAGWPPGEMIDRATEHGWETVFAPRNFGNGQPASNVSLRGSRPDPALDLIRAASAAEDREDRGRVGPSLPTIRSS
jgi:hypothetical protein